MTLLADVLDSVSCIPFSDLQRRAKEMPAHLFRRAVAMNPLVATDAARAHRIGEALAVANRTRDAWRDPEIYYPLFTLVDVAADAHKTEALLIRLEIQVGLRPVSDLALLADAYYRLTAVNGHTYRVDDRRVRELPQEPLARIEHWPGLVYLPTRRLFADILPAEHDHWTVIPSTDRTPVQRLAAGLMVLRRIEPELVADAADLISVIGLMPDEDASRKPADAMHLRWCFNLRLRYFGGLFLNLYPVDVYGAVEGIVHEYYHQRLWQWWEVELPSGTPDQGLTVVSPVTGMERQAIVMIQALVIYVGIHAVFRAINVARDGGEDGSSAWLETRIAHIGRHVPVLYETLRHVVEARTIVAKLLDATMDRFDASPN